MWKILKENDHYMVNELGEFKFARTGRLLKPYTHTRGYLKVSLYRDGVRTRYYAHRLVASNFLGDVKGLEVDHLNMVKTDNRVCNLEIVSKQENIRRYWKAVK